jgi:hypothetical protein
MVVIVHSNFAACDMNERAVGMMSSAGCSFTFEAMIVHTASSEVVQLVMAHEIAHGLIYAKFHSLGLPLPPLDSSLERLRRDLSEYPDAKRHEEQLVHEITDRWGFPGNLLELW